MIASERIQQIDKLFEEYAKPGLPGCALVVMKNGAISYKQGYGLANVEHSIPITTTTRFNIGSESKQFTAFATLLLVEEDKLSLDDAITGYIPETPDFGHTITIRHLLHHTSGLRCSFPALMILSGRREGDITTTADVLRLFQTQRELNFAPGEGHSYSNLGYVVLAEIVKRVSGQSFATFCKENIFEPLGMADTLVHDDIYSIIPHSAQSYATFNGDVTVCPLMDAVVGPTNVYTTAEDIAKWDENFYTGKVGSHKVITRMLEQGTLNNGERFPYACGLYINQHKGLKVIEHGGLHGGFCTWLIRFPAHHLSVAVLFNTLEFGSKPLALQVADLYLADTLQPEEETPTASPATPAIKLSDEQLKAAAGTYFHAGRAAVREVKYEDGELHAFGMTMIPVGDNEFTLSGSSETIMRFLPADGTRPDRIQIVSPVSAYVYDRVDATEPAHTDLQEYTGRYFCPELHALWSIHCRDGQLLIHRQKYADTTLTSLFGDAFRDKWAEVLDWPDYSFTLLFERDKQGGITGFSVTDVDARMRHLRFYKQQMEY